MLIIIKPIQGEHGMISYIKGAIIHKTEQSIMISGGMIGYEVFLPVNRLLNYSVGEEREF